MKNILRGKETLLTRILVAMLAVGAALINLWQSFRGIPLIDYAYQVDAAYRIFNGEIPYRDFFLVLPPGVYYYMAGLIAITGKFNPMVQIFGTMAVSLGTILISYALFSRVLKSPVIALVFVIPLLFAGHSIYAFANYDIAVCLILLASFLLSYSFQESSNSPVLFGFISGFITSGSILFKQNVGLPYLLCWLLSLLLIFIFTRQKKWLVFFIASLCGSVFLIGSFVLWLIVSGAYPSFIYQTIKFPASVRNPINGLLRIREDMGAFIYYYGIAFSIVLVIGLLAGLYSRVQHNTRQRLFNKVSIQKISKIIPILLTLTFFIWLSYSVINVPIYFFNTGIWFSTLLISLITGLILFYKDARYRRVNFSTFIPFLGIVIILTACISQGLWGSTYGIWPILFLLITWLFRLVIKNGSLIPWKPMAVISCAIISFFLFKNIQSQIRLWGYVYLDGDSHQSSLSNLTGYSTPGNWIPEFDTLIEYVDKNISPSDTVAFLPGEDIFFEATHRKNPLFCNQFLTQTCDKTVQEAINQCQIKQVNWLILKTKFQLGIWENYDQYPDMEKDTPYKLVKTMGIYQIYQLDTITKDQDG